MFSTVLLLLKDHWKVLAVILLIVGVYTTGYIRGDNNGDRQCEEILNKQKEEAELNRDRLQKEADKKAEEYEKIKAAQAKDLVESKRRLNAERSKNLNYANCRTGTEFLSIYKSVASKSEPAS